jgi:hypothetical protein
MLFYRASLPLSRQTLNFGWDHPPPPDLDRLAVAEAEPRAAGPPLLPLARGQLARAIHVLQLRET